MSKRRGSYLGGSTIVHRDPHGVDPRYQPGENAQEGADAIKRADMSVPKIAMPPFSDPNSPASKARDKMLANFRECVRLGLLVGMPGRIAPGETRISRARAELKRMKEQDRELATLRQAGDLEALNTETNAEAWQRLHDKSINFFDAVLSQKVPFDIDNAALIRIQNDTAQKVITISQKVAIERFRAQNIGALARVIERMRSRGALVEHEEPEPQHHLFESGPNAVTVAEIPETVEFDE